MLMSSGVRPNEAPPSFLTLIFSCAGQLAVTFDLFALTSDPCTRSHATPFVQTVSWQRLSRCCYGNRWTGL
ncbi:uncharacterized [Tachysurus ichikawai]